MEGLWELAAVMVAVLGAVGYLLWKIFRKGGGKGCGKCS
jgi:hypothetical protein